MPKEHEMQNRTQDVPARRVLVIVDRDFPENEPDARRLVEEVRGGDVLVVASAGAVPGERWIIDLTAREAQARRRLTGWIDALAPHARTIASEVGDADPGLARDDAQRDHAPHTVVTTAGADAPARPGWAGMLERRAANAVGARAVPQAPEPPAPTSSPPRRAAVSSAFATPAGSAGARA